MGLLKGYPKAILTVGTQCAYQARCSNDANFMNLKTWVPTPDQTRRRLARVHEHSFCPKRQFRPTNYQRNSASINRPLPQPSKKRIDIKKLMEDQDDWITLGNQRIHAWSISGLESCIVTKIDDASLAFDLGYATRPSVKCSDVFISHGHIDHIAAVVKHAAHRSLFSMKPATYHVPPHLADPLRKMAESVGKLHGDDENYSDINIKAVHPGSSIELAGGIKVVAFPTLHRVPSQGYIVYRTKKQLKQEYSKLPSPEIGKLIKEGCSVHDFVTTPELAYTGDTTFDVFKSPPLEDLLRVKTLITEATYIDDEQDKQSRGGVERARLRGHIHIQEIIDNEELFNHIENIVLVHFSDKYSTRYIRKKTEELLSASLKEKISLGILMKERLG